ncbi:hypothetical protein BELL_0005g00460 [Botrytis elliptica]|uniref:Rrn9 domain-containing protein n=1 Tax=Botrytis elliptica TaxID=278938 RepID=A0A4Z1K379_9HELO|nr:hypothetical protein EAE99_006854 [Botrytis elliptica]TGO80561.1 hypothetical protein BELL_0005g00460 [Botrytis elliptica]
MSSPTNSTFTNSSPPRENRWNGPASTWQQITEEERGLAASLDELRNRDLSLHLYNAFALKKRAKEFNADGTVHGKDEDQDNSNEFVPPKKWTAWPIEATEVPREGEQIGPDDNDEVFTLRRKETTKLSRDLEDELIGVTLKYSRERFLQREIAEDHERQVENSVTEGMNIDEPQQEQSEDPEIGEDSIRKSSEPPLTTTILRPEISADDERSQELLRPSIRHTLSKLDDVLMALHHARKTCRQYAAQTEFDTDVESRSRATSIAGDATDRDSPVKRPVGRPRKLQSIDPAAVPVFTPNENGLDDPELWRVKKTRRGRPKKNYARLEGETQHEYLTRVARIQKKPLPIFAPPIEPSTPKRERTPASVSPQKSPRKLLDKTRKQMLGLRDWSEVLGSAALVGFSPNVIARATQRCADLFGENMIMRTMVEGPAVGGKDDKVTEYYPGMIPDFDESEESGASFDEDEDEDKSSDSASDTENADSKDHPPIKQNASRIDSDEEMDGAVHTDRFLKPLTGKRGWRGIDKEKRKRSKSGVDIGDREQVSDDEESEASGSYSESDLEVQEEVEGEGSDSEH